MKVLIATHGTFAQGIQSAASIILGDMKDVDVINAYVDEISLKEKVERYFQDKEDEQVLILTDMFGGSVNQALMPYIREKGVWLVTGINLPCVLEILSRRERIDAESIQSIVKEAQKQVLFVNEMLENADSGDDFD